MIERKHFSDVDCSAISDVIRFAHSDVARHARSEVMCSTHAPQGTSLAKQTSRTKCASRSRREHIVQKKQVFRLAFFWHNMIEGKL